MRTIWIHGKAGIEYTQGKLSAFCHVIVPCKCSDSSHGLFRIFMFIALVKVFQTLSEILKRVLNAKDHLNAATVDGGLFFMKTRKHTTGDSGNPTIQKPHVIITH